MSMYHFMVPSNASGLEFTAVTVGKFQLRVGGPRVALACLFVAAFRASDVSLQLAKALFLDEPPA